MKPWEKAKAEQVSQSGMEKMLRSMGLGEVLDMAKRLANAGTAEKIITFADNLEPLMQRLERMEKTLERLASPGFRCEPGSTIELDTSTGQPRLVLTSDRGPVFVSFVDGTYRWQNTRGDGGVFEPSRHAFNGSGGNTETSN